MNWKFGLTDEQVSRIQAITGNLDRNRGAGVGWSIYRVPSTLNPPTTLRLYRRDSSGMLMQVIPITENGLPVGVVEE